MGDGAMCHYCRQYTCVCPEGQHIDEMRDGEEPCHLHGGPLDGHDLGFSCQAIDHTSVIALPYGDRTRRAVYRSSTFGIQTHWEFTGIEDVKPTTT